MGVIVPFDALDEQSELAPTQDNFPALFHLFECKEATTTSPTNFTDSVGGVLIPANAPTVLTSLTGDGNKITHNANNLNNIAGVWADLTTGKHPVVMIFTDDPNGGVIAPIIQFGGGSSSADSYIRFSGATGWAARHNGLITAASVANPLASPGGVMAVAKQGVSFSSYSCPTSTLVSVLNATDSTNLLNWSGGGLDLEGTIDGSGVYGVLFFAFTTIPGDLLLALQWMTYQWVVMNNKVIWPAWRNKT